MSASTFPRHPHQPAAATSASPISWLAMPRLLAVVAAAVGIVVLVFAAAIGAQQSTARELEQAQATLTATRATITAHAVVMRVQGEGLLTSARTTTSPHREHWIADAQAMIADAARLDATASLLANQAQLLGQHPGQSVRSDLAYIHGAGDALVAEGDRLVAHGTAVRTHAAAMEALAQTNETDIAQADAALLRDGADRITDAGERTRSIGLALRQVGERFMRSLGR